jgi:tRNA dimethylallyltransferase
MFTRGLPDEVDGLFRAGFTPDDPGLRAIGYREFFVPNEEAAVHEDETAVPRWRISRDAEGVEALVARNSRRYAKRQETFFASIPDIHWIEAPDAKREGQGTREDQGTIDLLSSLIHTKLNAND